MLSCAVNFAVRRWLLAALLALGLPAVAQPTIQFTKPADKDSAAQANPFLAPRREIIPAAAYSTPQSFFAPRGPTASFDMLPGSPQQVISPGAAAQWQKQLNNRKNWTLQTPEEILGIPTPAMILGIADPNDDPKLSAEDRFLQRRQREQNMAATNGMNRALMTWHGDNKGGMVFESMDATARKAGNNGGQLQSGEGRGLDSVFRSNPNGLLVPVQRPDTIWASSFDSAELPKQSPEQLAGMDRFRALMEHAPEKPQSAANNPYRTAAATPNPNMQVMPAYNPNGQSFTPLSDNIGRPTGITPLSGITGPRPQAKKPEPLVKPPPWMQTSLQSGNLPQRQF